MTDGSEPVAAGGQEASAGASEKLARTWAMLCHLTALIGLLVPLGFVLGPLIVWLIKRAEFPIVNDQGKESLNFQITMLIGIVIGIVLSAVIIGMFIIPAVLLYDIVMVVVASVKANSGVQYRYPFALRLIK